MGPLDRLLIALVPVLGILAGYIISRHTKKEIEDGRKYLNLLGHLVLAYVVFAILNHQRMSWAVVGAILVFLVFFLMKIEHGYQVMPLFAADAVLDPPSAVPLLAYNMIASSLDHKRKKKLTLAAGLYVLIAVVVWTFA